MRALAFLGIALLIFAPFNFVTIRQLLRIHPNRRRWILTMATIGNLMWPFILTLRDLTPLSRVVRAVLGPLWFAWTSFAIVYTALMLLVLVCWLPFWRRRFTNFARWPSHVFLTLTLSGSAIGFYQALVPLRIEHVPVFLENLPAEAEGMRIALMTDLHVGLFTRPSRLEKIFTTARALEPDVALILGDMIDDDPHYVPKLLAGTAALGPDIPLLAVLGNHEIYGDPRRVIEALRGSRIRLLVNEQVPMRSIVLAGLGEYGVSREPEHRALGPDIAKATAGAAFPILLSHQPKAFDEARARNIPLTLAGHTHGGQCGIRPLRWSLAGVFLEYHMGLYRRGASQLYVNTGTGYWFVPFRLGMTPEITLIELRRAQPSGIPYTHAR